MSDTQKKVAERLGWLMTKDGSGRLSSRNEYEKLTGGELAAFNLACELHEKFDKERERADKLLKELVVLQAYHAQAGITHPEELKLAMNRYGIMLGILRDTEDWPMTVEESEAVLARLTRKD